MIFSASAFPAPTRCPHRRPRCSPGRSRRSSSPAGVTGDGDPAKYRDRPDARVQIQHLAQRDVEASDAAADRRRQRPLIATLYVLNASSVSSGSHSPCRVLRLLAGEHFEPRDPLRAAEGLFHRRIEDAHTGAPDVGPVPSPSMNGTIGLSGTTSRPPCAQWGCHPGGFNSMCVHS